MGIHIRRSYGLAVVFLAAMVPARAQAVLDINDRGPVLNCGGFAMRVTNAGILGNAFNRFV